MRNIILLSILMISANSAMCQSGTDTVENRISVAQIFSRLSLHNFHPLNDGSSMTYDRDLKVAGIADLNNMDWKVRLLAVRDLVRAGNNSVEEIKNGLVDPNIYVRQVSAMALGILRANNATVELEKVVINDKNAIVRSQAVIALGQMVSKQSLELLRTKQKDDPSQDVRHQCDLAVDQIEKKKGTTEMQLNAFLSLDESTFESAQEGSRSPNFIMDDTDSKEWKLSQFRDKKWVVLIWVFADWCPVCHGEFQDLMKMQKEFKEADVQVFTVEIHDLYRGRVMVGKEVDPSYWFARESFQDAFTSQIWWPHLLDYAGTFGAIFGADPLAFSVHAEYINRPTTVIIDPKGIVRLIYPGTFWGDRPTIEQTLEMIKTSDFTFKYPKRLKTEK